MKKSFIYIAAAAVVTLFLLVAAHSTEDMEFVDNSVFDKPVRSASAFKHDQHNESAGIEDCTECHHVYEDGKKLADESSEDQRCSDCHELKGADGNPSLTKAFHANCKGCHKTQKAGPVMCGECHVKN
jgi:hypothetical protein